MDIKMAHLSIELEDGFKCPFCGRKVDTLNILIPGDKASAMPGAITESIVGYGCCDTANDSLFPTGRKLPVSNAELHELVDKAVSEILSRKPC